MDELLKEIDGAFRLMSSVPVTGDAIDTIAAARAKLRHVFNELQRMDEEQSKDGEKSAPEDGERE